MSDGEFASFAAEMLHAYRTKSDPDITEQVQGFLKLPQSDQLELLYYGLTNLNLLLRRSNN